MNLLKPIPEQGNLFVVVGTNIHFDVSLETATALYDQAVIDNKTCLVTQGGLIEQGGLTVKHFVASKNLDKMKAESKSRITGRLRFSETKEGIPSRALRYPSEKAGYEPAPKITYLTQALMDIKEDIYDHNYGDVDTAENLIFQQEILRNGGYFYLWVEENKS